MKRIVLVVISVGMAIVLCGCSRHAVDTQEGYSLLTEGKLSVIASLDNPPYEYYDANNPSGYGVAVIAELAERLGLSCDIHNIDASNHDEGMQNCITALEEDKYDVALGSYLKGSLDNAEVDYTEPYYEANYTILVKKDTYEARSKLVGKKVAAIGSSPCAQYVTDTITELLVEANSAKSCADLLEAGDVAAVVLDTNQAKDVLDLSSQYEVLEEVAVGQRYVFAVARIDEGLANTLSQELAAMEEDGTLARLQDAWL